MKNNFKSIPITKGTISANNVVILVLYRRHIAEIVVAGEVNKIVTRKGGLNCDPLKIILKLKSDSQVVYLEWLS